MAGDATAPDSMRSYFVWFAATLFAVLAVVAAINFYVDPDGRFRVVDKPGFNQLKVTLKRDSRLGKIASLWECSVDTLLLGTSRIESGIRTDVAGLPGRVYNGGLKAGSMLEMERLGRFALRRHSLQQLVVGLDFFAFNEQRVTYDHFGDSLLGDGQSPASVAMYLASLEKLFASRETVYWNRSGRVDACFNDGYFASRELTGSQAGAFTGTLERFRTNPQFYGDYLTTGAYMDLLRDLLVEAQRSGVPVALFISPMHSVLQDLLQEQGLDDDYAEWKSQLVAVVDELNAVDQPAIALWDFATVNSVTTESVPDGDELMQFYRDPSHYTPLVGEWVVARMFGSEASQPVPTDFGVLLSSGAR